MRLLFFLSFLLMSCSPVFYKSFIATYSNGYVLDADKKVIATYSNGYVLDADKKVIATYSNGYVLDADKKAL